MVRMASGPPLPQVPVVVLESLFKRRNGANEGGNGEDSATTVNNEDRVPTYARREPVCLLRSLSVCPVPPFVNLRSLRRKLLRGLRSAWNQRTAIARSLKPPALILKYRVGRWQGDHA